MLSADLLLLIAPAFVAGLMIALTHAPLGIDVLKRGIIFIDLAIAQIAGLGLVATATFFHHPHPLLVQGSALVCALTAALVFQRLEKTAPQRQEAIIGCAFVLAASLSLLLLAHHPHGGEEIQHLLSGQILFVTWRDVFSHAPVYACILLLWFTVKRVRQGLGFYTLFAVAITSSVQLAGVYVVFASLILPALAASHAKNPYITAWICGGVSVSAAIIISTIGDYPAGPVIVTAYAVCAAAIAVRQRLSRRR